VGGNDSADGNDLIESGFGADLVFGNGGADTLLADDGSDTVIAGIGDDSANLGTGNNLAFGNEGNDTLAALVSSQSTVFGGIGDDSIRTNGAPGLNRDMLQGNEGNDTIRGRSGVDTISGGSGSDVFAYTDPEDDGDNAVGGGPMELITDVDFAVDRFLTPVRVTFAANVGVGTGADLNASANNAIAAAFALAGGGAAVVAAQLTFGGRTFLAIDQVSFGAFADNEDLLLDITGMTGSIAASNFI
jgi:Ca2+-binding RTX toxin-like protein